MLIWFLPLFLLFLLIGLPVFFGLLAAPGILLWLNDQSRDGAMLYRNIYNGIDSFPLMAIPFFMLAGELMNRGGITQRLVEFSQAMMGHLKGGLAHVNLNAFCWPIWICSCRYFCNWFNVNSCNGEARVY
jgi:TRAP-type mannitol/chloroaromatic compound transport system permease large subunit